MIAGLNLTDTKIADGQLSSAAPETDGGDFAALLQPLSPQQDPNAPGADGTGDTPAQPTADAALTAQESDAAADSEQQPAEAAIAPQLPIETTLQAEQGLASAGFTLSAQDSPAAATPDTSGGKVLPPTGNNLQQANAVAADQLSATALQAAAEPAAGTMPGLAPDPTAIQKNLRVDGQTSAMNPLPDNVASAAPSQRPAPAAPGLETRAPLPAADALQLADDSLPTQGQEFSTRLGATAQAALNTGAPASQAAAAFTDADASTLFTSNAPSETAGRGLPDSAAAERALRLPIQQFAGQPGWGEEVRSNLQWLSRQGVHRAELQLHPAELGSIDVRITTENDQASVMFYAANRSARELLEAELPRLRELFSQIGVELTQADVAERQQDGQGLESGQPGYDDGHSSSIKESATDADNRNEAAGSLAVDASGAQNLIDYYI